MNVHSYWRASDGSSRRATYSATTDKVARRFASTTKTASDFLIFSVKKIQLSSAEFSLIDIYRIIRYYDKFGSVAEQCPLRFRHSWILGAADSESEVGRSQRG